MLKVKFLNSQTNIEGKSIILPSLCTQAPSIALDYLISSNQFNKIGFVIPPYLYMQPSIGYLPKSISKVDEALGLPIQLYSLGDIVIVQLRSGVRFGRKKQLISELIKLFTDLKVTEVLMVGVLRYQMRPDLQILASQKNMYILKSNKKMADKFSITNIINDPINRLVDVYQLKDSEEQIEEVLETAGLAFQMQKIHQKEKAQFSLTEVFMFGQQIEVKKTGIALAQNIRKILGGSKKQLGNMIREMI